MIDILNNINSIQRLSINQNTLSKKIFPIKNEEYELLEMNQIYLGCKDIIMIDEVDIEE